MKVRAPCRSSPDGVVYTFGAQGQLHAVDLAKGTRLWSEDTMKRFNVPKGYFGAGGSPLVEGGRVIANIGGDKAGLVAFEAKTGKIVWTATEDDASYSSGMAATIGGRRLAIFLTRDNLLGLDPATGMIQFQRRWRSRSAASVNAATPLVVGDSIFVSAEYGPGAGVLRVEGSKLVDVWASDEALSNHYMTSVYRDGYLYGFHGRQEYGPSLRAVEFKTGAVKWSQDQFRAGSITLVGDKLLIIREGGEMILAPASPQAFKPLARAQILPGVVRPLPAIADGFVYRSQREHARLSRSSTVTMRHMRHVVLALAAVATLAAPVSAQRSSENPREILDRAIEDFLAGRVTESVTGFDRVVALAPQVAPQLWQRGIALYYAGRYQDCRTQFESHRTVNPNDVENPAWHFLCVAKAESPANARAALLPVGPDQRSPMREIYQMFRGTMTPDAILKVAGDEPSSKFFAELYVGLYYDATGDRTRALEHLRRAAAKDYASAGGYMHRVAELHPLLRRP
jgi:tetratricopeptide (TPR) repeat protein